MSQLRGAASVFTSQDGVVTTKDPKKQAYVVVGRMRRNNKTPARCRCALAYFPRGGCSPCVSLNGLFPL